MPTEPSLKNDTARFAHLAAVLDRLQALVRMYDDAAEIFVNFPKLRREEIEHSDEPTSVSLAHGLARSAPAARDEERQGLLQDVQALQSVLEDNAVPTMRFNAKDLDLIIDFVLALDMLQPRSKRELCRLFDAMRANDIGTLTATSVPSKGLTRQKLEMTFTNEARLPVVGKAKSSIGPVDT